MKDDKVILELSHEDAARLLGLLDGLYLIRPGSSQTKVSLLINARVSVYKTCFGSYNELDNWCWKLDTLVCRAINKYLADSVDPIIP